MRNLWVVVGASAVSAAVSGSNLYAPAQAASEATASEPHRDDVARILQRNQEDAPADIINPEDVSEEANALLEGEEVVDEFGEIVVPAEERTPENLGFSAAELSGKVDGGRSDSSRRLAEEGEVQQEEEEGIENGSEDQEGQNEGNSSRRLADEEEVKQGEEEEDVVPEEPEEGNEGNSPRLAEEGEVQQEEEEGTENGSEDQEGQNEGNSSRRLADEEEQKQGTEGGSDSQPEAEDEAIEETSTAEESDGSSGNVTEGEEKKPVESSGEVHPGEAVTD